MNRYDGSAAELQRMVEKNGRNFERGYYKEMSAYLMATRYTKEQILKVKDDIIENGKAHTRHSENALDTLFDWFEEHRNHPYPTNAEKHQLEQASGLSQRQIVDWFVNQRKRHWTPPQPMRSLQNSAKPGPPARRPMKKKENSDQVNPSLTSTPIPTNSEEFEEEEISDQVNPPLTSTPTPTHSEEFEEGEISDQVNCPLISTPIPKRFKKKKEISDQVNRALEPTPPKKKTKSSELFDLPELVNLADIDEDHATDNLDAPDIAGDAFLPPDVAADAFLPPDVAADAFLPQDIAADAFIPDPVTKDAFGMLPPLDLEDQHSLPGFVEPVGVALDDGTHGGFIFHSFEQIDMEALEYDEPAWENPLDMFLWDHV